VAKEYQRLWKDVTSANDEGEAVRTLAGIMLDEEGRAFISNLERVDAELCTEILDRVSRDLYPFPSFAVSDGFFRALQCTSSEPQRNSFLRHVEEARRNSWATARFHDDNRRLGFQTRYSPPMDFRMPGPERTRGAPSQ